MKSLEQECLDLLALLRHEVEVVTALSNALRDHGMGDAAESVQIRNLRDEIAQKEAWLAELRQTRSDVVVVDYRKQFEARVQALPSFTHYERLTSSQLEERTAGVPEAGHALLRGHAPLCFVLHKNNTEVFRAVMTLKEAGRWAWPIIWFTGEVTRIGSIHGDPLVPRDFLAEVGLPLLERHAGDVDGFRRVVAATELCATAGYTHGDEERFARHFDLIP